MDSERDRTPLRALQIVLFKQVLIPVRSNKDAFDALTMSFPYSVGGESCPAEFAQKQASYSVLRKFLYLINAINA